MRWTGANGELRIRLVGDDEMSDAHERYMGISGTTDVLTFDLSDGDPEGEGGEVDTDVLICVDEAARQAAEHDHPVEQEILLYAIHALLHCTGYDDKTEADAEAMHRREDEILEAIGVGSTYRSAGASRGDDR